MVLGWGLVSYERGTPVPRRANVKEKGPTVVLGWGLVSFERGTPVPRRANVTEITGVPRSLIRNRHPV